MRGAVIIATGLGLALCARAEAQEIGGMAWAFGMGTQSCAYWLSNYRSENAGEHWISGYWSGLNVGNTNDHDVGHTVDAEGIIGEVKKFCKDHPSELLTVATGTVYFMLGSRKR
jgi:hypothetical protein